MVAESESRDRRPEEPARADDKRALDASQELFCRDIAARVRRWVAEGRPVRRKGA
ncbi:hypothetical protein [Olsenella sp. An293]|uniref:hypothetical protein n=1 Tax=Olsenella sp. An293 TaxID=1965626 RepID=UPI0013028EDF|nr:hypothetical protein [Olsenella sp. An293]